nr:MAG TPA: hypothetical protein [Caudoviricetes sp.]
MGDCTCGQFSQIMVAFGLGRAGNFCVTSFPVLCLCSFASCLNPLSIRKSTFFALP